MRKSPKRFCLLTFVLIGEAEQRKSFARLGRVSHDAPTGAGWKSQPLVGYGEAEPKTPRRARWGKRLIWTKGGRVSHDSPIARAAGLSSDFFFLFRWLRRGETPNGNEPTTFLSRPRPPGAYARSGKALRGGFFFLFRRVGGAAPPVMLKPRDTL